MKCVFTGIMCALMPDILFNFTNMKFVRMTVARIFSLLLFACIALAQVKLRERDILLANRPVNVYFGRTVILDPLNTLRIHVRAGDTCLLTVLDNSGELAYTPGKLSKTEFPCNFGPEEVSYIHFGGRKFREHHVQLLLRYDSATETLIIPFSLLVKIHDRPSEIISRNNALSVDHQQGYSTQVDLYSLQFSYDKKLYACRVSVVSPSSGLPQYGYLLNNTNTLTNVDCDAFLTYGVRYKHHAQPNSPKNDFIPMHVQLLRENGEIGIEEYFQLQVSINSGKVNTPPEPSRNALFVMDSINQFVMTAITPDIVSATDGQTPSDRLLFNITQPLGPGEGIIVNTDNRNIPIFSFYQHDINDLKIAYKPPSSDSNIKRMFQLWVTIFDPDGLSSDSIPLMIVVEPMNTYAPLVTTNTGIQLIEGQSRPIVSPDVLEISDEDSLEDVRIYHIDGLRNGHLTLPAGKKFFTLADLRTGKVVYHHDDSDTFSDNIIFRMTDGMHEVEFLFPVTIFPKDDHPPALIVNTGLEIQKHGFIGITTFVLSAADIDTDDTSIIYTLETPYSRVGTIVKRQFEMPINVVEWEFNNRIYEQAVTSFTQKDVMEGKIFYKHAGAHASEIVLDTIRFCLTDNGQPPNKSPTYELSVKILPIDDIPPYLYPNTQLQLEVDETQLTHFRRKTLRYSDDDTNDREIRYIITQQPLDTYDQGPSDAGIIVNCDEPGRPIYRFDQSQINHQKICYQPPKSELGIATRIIQFGYYVEDQAANKLENQLYNIILKPVDNQPPLVTNAGAILYENSEVIIGPKLLDIKDDDTDLGNLIIIVRRTPKHGHLFKDRRVLSVGNTFKRSDIVEHKIIYRNQGENIEVTDDNFILEVSDGTHFIPVTFKIIIKPIDDEPGRMDTSGKLGKLDIHLEVMEKQTIMLRPENFKITDLDTDVRQITYAIRKYPDFGHILRNGHQSSYFTQSDLLKGIVEFKHVDKEIGHDEIVDTVQLTVRDNYNILLGDGTRLREIFIRIKIMPIDDSKPEMTVGHNIVVLEGEKTEVLPQNINAKDADSNEDDILCLITGRPSNGFIENQSPMPGSEKSREGIPVSSFTIGDIRRRNVFYVQNAHKGLEPRRDQVTVQCSDGINVAKPVRLNVVIQASNDEEPQVFVREFIGSEGMVIRIDKPILNAIDSDEPADKLMFVITKQPKHGRIMQQTQSGNVVVHNFTLNVIEQSSTIVYEHDDTETISDHFEFLLTDGVHNISKSVPIIIIPVDDETPRLAINNGLEIENLGDRKLITNDILKADDIDSFIGNITFIIRRVPQFGTLTKHLRNGMKNLTFGSNFTQLDIDNNLIEYIHTGHEAKRDLIKFDVTDGINPLIDRYFYVTIQGMDIIYPEVINRGVELPEGGSVILNTAILSGTDMDSPDEDLKFIITETPDHGYVAFVDSPEDSIDKFSQLDLAAHRVRYVHNASDEIKMDTFEFKVTDGFNPVSRTFRIALTAVDNKLPVVMFTTLRLKEGENKIITPFELKAVDMDTANDQIIFTITQVPLHGNLLYNFSRIVTRFSQADLNNNLISYQQDGTETMSDSFIFTVSDGTHLQFFVPGSNIPTRHPQELDIDIIPIDNGIPRVSINTGATSLTPLDLGLGFTFTNQNIRCDDKDSPVESLRFVLTVPPKHGYIRNIRRGNGAVVIWTQGEIDKEQIQYILQQGENASSDSFFFKVIDEGGNSLENQPFHLNWGWISFKTSQITVDETQEILEVTLLRRGYLGETSFVTINVTERTASVGKDVSRQFAQQVQFNPGQTEKHWRLPIRDDNVYEREETLVLQMTKPELAVLEYPEVAMVTIQDPEDEATVFFPEVVYKVEENVGKLEVPVYRVGDLSEELQVICYTKHSSAKGTPANRVESFSDFISRPTDHNSIVRFNKGDDKKMCTVTVIDDSLFEEEEKFYLVLYQPMGGRIGENGETEITILPDESDEPKFYFDQTSYHVDESIGTLEVKVWKTGTDISRPSSVTVRSRKTDTNPAEASTDYLPVIRILDFAPGEMTKTLQVTILDDLGHPRLEGAETFELHLRMPVGGSIEEPSVAMVTINDTLSDLPRMQFVVAKYQVLESEGQVVAMVTRSGDISSQSQVRCFTRQASALVDIDYIERPDTNASVIVFQPNEREAPCVVDIIDDTVRENEESFRLVLGSPEGKMPRGATLGGQITTRILVDDPEDSPIIKFEQNRYTVNEPIIKGDMSILRVAVIRLGDVMDVSKVKVYTKSGSATAGRDFNAYHREFVFNEGERRKFVEIEILYDVDRENSESFSLNLWPDTRHIAQVTHNSRATIYIEENSKLADVIFPEAPVVVSLQDYDFLTDVVDKRPVQGYPLVCVSACNRKHPKFPIMQHLCETGGIDDSLTKFRWRVGPPADNQGATGWLRDLEMNTVFTNTRHITLDSVYFTGGSQVQCYARAVNEDGEPGKELGSPIITVDIQEGICPPRKHNYVGADPFTARLWYTGPDDVHHPNTVRLTVQIPHTDGMFPAVSTNVLSNFEYALSYDGFRPAQHRCSNLVDIKEHVTRFGFITNGTKRTRYTEEIEPYQYSKLRSNKTLRFYKNLDLESCLWTFEGYFDMSELVSACGAVVETDGQVLNIRQSFVSVRVPLYVSYLYYTSEPTASWRNFDLSTQMRLRFVYNTAILWQEGIPSPQDQTGLQGQLYPSSMRIGDDSRMIVIFRTVPNFRGQFLQVHPSVSVNSSVTSVDDPDLQFDLTLLTSEPTFDQPGQMWKMVSKTVMKDYSGDYKVNLLPCTVTLTQSYVPQFQCTPGDLVTFDLPIRFQQVSDPVPAKFSLNTRFSLLRKRELWVSENLHSVADDDTAFAPGDTIYGRIDVDPVQSLGNQFNLNIEKVFLCSGKDGYIPRYDPDNGEYGCVGGTEKLDSIVRIVDADAPHTVDTSYNGIPLGVLMAREDSRARDLLAIPGADGFSFDSSPLFQMQTGKQWFLHAIYSIQSKNRISKRSLIRQHLNKRSLDDVSDVGNGEKGTNMTPLILDVDGKSIVEENRTDKMRESDDGQMTVVAALIGVGIFLLIGLFILVIFIRHRRKHASPPPTPSGTITVMSTSTGQTRVISNAHYFKPTDHSEV